MNYNYKKDEKIREVKLNKIDVSNPITFIGWELRRVRGMKNTYVRLIFKKLSKNVKAFKFSYFYLDDFAEKLESSEVQEQIVRDLEKEQNEFFILVPAEKDTVRVELSIKQCLLVDDSIISNSEKVFANIQFESFSDKETVTAVSRLITTAKGYPNDQKTVWTCACGELNSKSNTECIYCHTNKTEVFEKITAANVRQKIEEIQEENRLRKERELAENKAREAKLQEENRILKEKAALRKKKITIVLAITIPIIIAILAVVISLSVHYFMTAPIVRLSEDGIVYLKRYDGTYEVVDFDKSNDEVTIPFTVRGVKVTSIGNYAFYDCTSLTTVTIPDSVTSIGNYAFV